LGVSKSSTVFKKKKKTGLMKKPFVFGSNDPNEYALNMILLHITQYIYRKKCQKQKTKNITEQPE